MNKKLVQIQAFSSGYNGGNFALIRINGKIVKVEKNEHNHYRGLHIVVINPKNFKVVFSKVFDTNKPSS